MSICICSEQDFECSGNCAGAIAQQQQCEQEGHLTPESIHQRVWGTPPEIALAAQGFCYRCGYYGN